MEEIKRVQRIYDHEFLASCHRFETRSLAHLQPQLRKKEWVGREVVNTNAPSAYLPLVLRTDSPHLDFRTRVVEHPRAMAS
jgi:hypothetical protein